MNIEGQVRQLPLFEPPIDPALLVRAGEIRLAIAEQELRNHDQQIENACAVDRFLRDKFTNQELY